VGQTLTQARTAAAAKIKPLVEAQLRELGMAEASFGFMIGPAPEPGPSGADAVEMMVRTNPGQAERPLRKIASGGEMSRIMLAIKSILAGSDRISVLVFDEIDANIGGRLGSVIGRKMRDLTRGAGGTKARRHGAGKGVEGEARHQVLCITHLPQIAAFGDRHLHIRKAVTGKGKSRQTVTTVARLEGEDRVVELAEMMAGRDATSTTRKQAEEMLAGAGG
jgi:DNA repair protein RecN (Recombination protein N)